MLSEREREREREKEREMRDKTRAGASCGRGSFVCLFVGAIFTIDILINCCKGLVLTSNENNNLVARLRSVGERI